MTERLQRKLDEALEATGERAAAAREATVAGLESAGERLAEVRAAAEDLGAKVKPRLRGVIHEYAFFVSLALGAALVSLASGSEARIAAGIYVFSLSALLGTSALYHRINWKSPDVRRWVRRLDHSMIFVLIAGTVTPFAMLVIEGPFATAVLITAWAAALAGIIVELIWLEAPKYVSAIVYVTVGLVGAIGFPPILVEAGLGAGLLVATGGAIYGLGAVVYARQSPNPSPGVFGYHEVFHVMVVVAAALHFAAVALYAVPIR